MLQLCFALNSIYNARVFPTIIHFCLVKSASDQGFWPDFLALTFFAEGGNGQEIACFRLLGVGK
jgi:hypothetical protein